MNIISRGRRFSAVRAIVQHRAALFLLFFFSIPIFFSYFFLLSSSSSSLFFFYLFFSALFFIRWARIQPVSAAERRANLTFNSPAEPERSFALNCIKVGYTPELSNFAIHFDGHTTDVRASVLILKSHAGS